MFWIRIVYYIKNFTDERKGDCHLNNDSHTIVMIHKVAIIKNIKNRLKELSCPDLYLFFPRRPWLVCHMLFLFFDFFWRKTFALIFLGHPVCAFELHCLISETVTLWNDTKKWNGICMSSDRNEGLGNVGRGDASATQRLKRAFGACLCLCSLPGMVSPHRKVLRTLILRPQATARQAFGRSPHKQFEPIVMEHPPSASRLPHSPSPNTHLCSLAVTDRKDLTT